MSAGISASNTGAPVFLCGTHADLKAERAAVLEAVNALRKEHTAMEVFGAHSQRPIDVCLKEVARSALVVVVIGERYGTTVPGRKTSFTEAEYNEAKRLYKPRLVYLRDPEVPILLRNVDRDTNSVERLTRWKARIARELTTDTFAAPDELATKVSGALQSALASLEGENRRAAGMAPAPQAAPATDLSQYESRLQVNRSLAVLAPKFRASVENAIAVCRAEGQAVVVYETYRSPELQALYYARGRTIIPPVQPVTNAASNLDSWHGYGLAVDVIDQSKAWSAPPNWFGAVAAVFKEHGCHWGGDSEGAPDLPHFHWGGCPARPGKIHHRLIAQQGITEVWKLVGAM